MKTGSQAGTLAHQQVLATVIEQVHRRLPVPGVAGARRRPLREYAAVNPPPVFFTPTPWSLVPHAASPWRPAFTLSVALTPDRCAGLRLDYALTGDLANLRLPAPMPPGPADGLWRHTCFEAFVGGQDGGAYREFNFSPSGQWADYRFAARRTPDAAPDPSVLIPEVLWRSNPGHLRLCARLPASVLPPAGTWRVGLSAVLEHQDGRLSYWALAHPGIHPDFHDPAGWRPLPAAPDISSP